MLFHVRASLDRPTHVHQGSLGDEEFRVRRPTVEALRRPHFFFAERRAVCFLRICFFGAQKAIWDRTMIRDGRMVSACALLSTFASVAPQGGLVRLGFHLASPCAGFAALRLDELFEPSEISLDTTVEGA